MMKNIMFRKFVATLLVAMMLVFPAIQPLAADTLSGMQTASSDEMIIDSIALGENTNSNAGEQKITLITGDVVTVTEIGEGKSVISVEPVVTNNSGFQIMTLGEDTFVIPTEAMTHVAADLLDKNLFNITQLIADGYDDENQSTLPVIVQYHETNARFDTSLPTTLAGSERTNVLKSIDGIAVSTDKKQAELFWEDIKMNAADASEKTGGIKKVWLDGRVQVNLAESVPQVGAPAVWNSGYTGEGVTVAVLDTGVDAGHKDLSNQIIDIKSFVPGEDSTDYHGHGTHVASTVLGTGEASDELNIGVAPGANLLVGKVLSNSGYGQDSWIIEGMEWAAENADIVNMSLGDPRPSDGKDPLSQAVNELSEKKGTLFVIAAGNSGAEGIGAPGAADSALTVGNVTKQDRLSFSSTMGPRYMNEGLKPDLVAPGTDIFAARSSYSMQGDGLYLGLSGTSMASPHVAGAAALLKQKYPNWNGEQLKAALMSSTKKIDSIKPYQGGSGRLDVDAATTRTVFANGSIDFGFFRWPHDDNKIVEKTVTYTNISDEPVVLDLISTFTDKNGLAVPEGLLELSENQITVPANGYAEVVVTFNPNFADLDQRYQGHLTAENAGEIVATSAMAVGVEGERHTLKINATNTKGEPGQMVLTLVGKDFEPTFFNLIGESELRLEPGTYSVFGMMDVDTGTDYEGVAVLGNPEIVLDGDKTVTLDARNANEITVDIPDKNTPSFRKMELYRSFGGSKEIEMTYIIPQTKDKLYAQTVDPVSEGIFEFNTRWRLSKPTLSINVEGREVETLALPGGTPFDGEFELPVVYAGNGTPNEYKNLDVKDKAVIIKRSNNISGSERANAASKAGAKLLIIVNNEDSKYREWVGKADNSLNPIAVSSMSGIAGQHLIETAINGKLTINAVGTSLSPYMYDLIQNHRNGIPADLNYAPTKEELVRIDARYYSDVDEEGEEFRWDLPTYRENGIGFREMLTLPSTRTEWVSADEGTLWYHEARIPEWEIRQPVASYKPGEHLKENWFSPVVRPRFGEGFWVPERFENDLQFNIVTGADGGIGNTGWMMGMPGDSVKLYKGDTLLEEENYELLFHTAEEDLTEYRLVVDATRDPNRWNNSVKTHTEWTFLTELQEEFHTFLPMISLDYVVDTDMQGNALGGDTIKLGLLPSQISYASGNGNIEGATLEVSFDEGKQWDEVQLVQDGEGWIAEISNPLKGAGYASIRASAWDDVGNKIEQEIIKAFGIAGDEIVLSTDETNYSLEIGATQQMTVTEVTTPEGGGESTTVDVTNEATYVVEDETVATVENGLITAKAEGTTRITISYGGYKVVVSVKVTDPDSDSTVTLSTDKAEYVAVTGATQQMSVTEVTTPKGDGEVTTVDVTNEATYVVEDETVATVENGLITAKVEGTTQVTISYGGNEVTVSVTVTDADSESTVTLSTDKAEYALTTGATQQMTVTEVTTPKGEGEATTVDVTKEATYTVEDETVATVKDGLITAKLIGSTKVVVTYGDLEVTVNVTVTNPYIPSPDPGPNPGPNPDPGPVDPKPETPVFSDITNTFAEDEINKLAAKGIIQGKTETTFAPNALITRAEFTVLLARALDLPLKEYEGKFKDVNTSKKWAYAGIEAAATAGIVNGTLDGKFNPDAPIKREEIAAMVVRAIEYKDKAKLDNLETPANFKDHGSIGAHAIDSVYKATALGVIKGNEGQFKPKNNATRAEAAVMLYRALDTLKLLD